LLRFDDYDYETDDPAQTLYYRHGDRTVHFSDIAQLRERDGQLWYDYWELTGAKMWITNGRMAGVFCLYAKTEEGITGFLVDRHVEGLIVGKDEAKMGQLGSPTNELSLQAVRVPRENVLGLEGRGQVNALETLNVGRAGLAMSAMAQMDGLISQSRAFSGVTYGETPDWVAWRLERMEEARFIAEAVAHEVIGRFEHPGTKSVRMESAISKMLVSELLHEIIEFAEDIHGLAGQTQFHLVEKRKRDARILNIYEGTNEIQRFFILKDLAAEIAPRWASSAGAPLPAYMGPEAVMLQALKAEFRQRAGVAVQVFGQQLWQNPNLQANCFLLAEIAAWIMAGESTLGRLAWLEQRANTAEESESPAALGVGRRAALRCQQEIRQRLTQFDEELTHLRRGFYAAEVRGASLLFQRQGQLPRPEPLVSEITKPLSVLVIIEPSPADVPEPYVSGGRLAEPYLTLNNADRSALETALSLRDQAHAPVLMTVAAVGPRWFLQALREVVSLNVDHVHLVLSDGETVAPDSAASALTALLGGAGPFNLVLGGAGDDANEEGTCARLTAAGLGVPHVGAAAALAVRNTAMDTSILLMDPATRRQCESPLPAAVSVKAGAALRSFNVDGYLNKLANTVELERWPKKVLPRKVLVEASTQPASAEGMLTIMQPISPQAAADLTLERAGVTGTVVPSLEPFAGKIEELQGPPAVADAVVGVLAADAAGRLQASATEVLSTTALYASAEAAHAVVLVLASGNEETQRRVVQQVVEVFEGHIILLASAGNETAPPHAVRFLTDAWSLLTSRARVVIGEAWAETAFMRLSCADGRSEPAAFRVRAVTLEDGLVMLESARCRGKLRATQRLEPPPGSTVWVGLAPEAEVLTPAPSRAAGVLVQRWQPLPPRRDRVDDMRCLLETIKAEAGVVSLAEAEFIVDAGFGVVNRDGYEKVIEPLERALRDLGVRGLAVGGSRKVTEELHLLPADRQIGQSGIWVNPQILLAIGVSGAPQHLNYIGPGATIVAFNRDPEAPIMTLNHRQPRPRVYPVVGDLFETVPAFVVALRQEKPPATPPTAAVSEKSCAEGSV
jgi:electron transfer flavoprotein alpha subunit